LLIYKARAPVRICDMGGWTDIELCKKLGGGCVTSMAVSLYSQVAVEPNGSDGLMIISENLGTKDYIEDYRRIEYDGTLNLLRAALKRMGINQGLTVRIKADAPPGCGVGTSASVAVALLGAIHLMRGLPIDKSKIAALAQKLETEELKLLCGVQDQWAAAFGGWNMMEIDYPEVNLTPITPPEGLIPELESRMLLVYFGPRSSNKQHGKILNNFASGHDRSVQAFSELKENGQRMYQALQNGDINLITWAINQNWRSQNKLVPPGCYGINTRQIDWVSEVAFENGAIAFDTNGAGGGGSAILLAEEGKEYQLEKALREKGIQLLPFRFDFTGLQVWKT